MDHTPQLDPSPAAAPAGPVMPSVSPAHSVIIRPTMARMPQTSSLSPIPALSADERAIAENIGGRLAAELAAALGALPAGYASSRTIAEYLDVAPTVCHRALTASQLSTDPLAALEKAPGVAGLRALAKGLARRGVKPGLIRSLDAAIEQFAKLVRDSGNSHAKLQRRLAATRDHNVHEPVPTDEHAEREQRRRLFQATASWLGSRLDTHAAITIGRTVPDQPDFIEGAKINAFLGHRARLASLPLVTANLYRSGEPKRGEPSLPTPSPDAQPLDSATLLREFSSSGSHMVSTRTDQNHSVQIIDPSVTNGDPIDAVVMTRLPRVRHPLRCARQLFFSIVRIEHPCKHFVSDVWLKRSLAAGSVPTAHLAWFGEPLRGGEGVPWYHRLPGEVTLEVLTPETLRSTDAWPRQAEATRHAFDTLGWPLAEFIGYRVRLEYPPWGAAVAIIFDYSTEITAPIA